ncbi:MAG: hypothetical protein ACKOVB_09905 [Terrabacter sp.]
MIFSPLGVLRMARSTWRSMTKRSLGTIGLLNFDPVGTFHFLLGLPGLRAARAVGAAEAAVATPPAAGAADAVPTAGASSAAAMPQVASRAMNLERTSTTPSGCLSGTRVR